MRTRAENSTGMSPPYKVDPTTRPLAAQPDSTTTVSDVNRSASTRAARNVLGEKHSEASSSPRSGSTEPSGRVIVLSSVRRNTTCPPGGGPSIGPLSAGSHNPPRGGVGVRVALRAQPPSARPTARTKQSTRTPAAHSEPGEQSHTAARHAVAGALSSATRTAVISSSTRTTPSRSQSPGHRHSQLKPHRYSRHARFSSVAQSGGGRTGGQVAVAVGEDVGVLGSQEQPTRHCSSSHTRPSPGPHVCGGAAGGQVRVPVTVGVGVVVAQMQSTRHSSRHR